MCDQVEQTEEDIVLNNIFEKRDALVEALHASKDGISTADRVNEAIEDVYCAIDKAVVAIQESVDIA